MNKNGKATLAVTGATGFIGRYTLEVLSRGGLAVRGISRGARPDWASGSLQWSQVAYDDIDAMRGALEDAEFVLHLADDPHREAARDVSQAAAVARVLTDAASMSGLKGIIMASSVYARMQDAAYGRGKRGAEQALLENSDMPTVILRLPPVYGPGGRGGLNTLAALVAQGLPLPFGSATEPRHYLSRRNLAELIRHIVAADPAAWSQARGRIFEPSDGQAMSTRDLIEHLARVQGRSALQLPVPTAFLRFAGKVSGREALVSGAVDRLDVVPNTELSRLFGWTPEERMPESLDFLSS